MWPFRVIIKLLNQIIAMLMEIQHSDQTYPKRKKKKKRNKKPTKVISVKFSIPIYSAKGGIEMPGSLTLPDDMEVTVPLIFRDAVGVVHAPPGGGSVAVDDTNVCTASVSDDDTSVVIVSVADGTATVTYTNDNAGNPVSDTVTVTVAMPTPTSVDFDEASAVFGPKP